MEKPTNKQSTTNAKTKPQGNKKSPKKKKFNFRKLILGSIIATILAIICAMAVYIVVIMSGFKILETNIDKIETTTESTLIYAQEEGKDKQPTEIAKIYKGENRESVKIKDVPERLKQAFIATEDRRFEQHSGVDFWAIGRALVKDVIHMSAVEGGSTITQQLAKNVFLSSEKTAFRKGTEMSIAFALDEKYTKDEILEFYLNRIFFGSNAYGIKSAAKVYFGKSNLNDLEVWEMATLAALPKAPSKYSPLANPDLSKERRAVVLKLMADQGYITEAERAKAAAVDYTPPAVAATSTKDYASYVDYVMNEAEDMYGIDEDELLTKGYRIYTSMNTKAQQVMEKTYANPSFFQKDASDGQKIQSAMVIVDNKTGGLMAMIGGRDYKSRGFSRIYSKRQPGSSFKPIAAYGPALESGDYTPYSMMDDSQTSFGNGTYSPRNYDRVTHGQVTMLEAVKKSYNLAPVWLLDKMGVNAGINFAKNLGIQLNPQKDKNLAIALGGLTDGVSPLQMATAYSAFANQGSLNKTHAILRITDAQGKEIAAYKAEKKQVIQPKTAYYMTLLLQGVVETGGTGTKAKFNRPVAGKTGSTGLDIKGIEQYDRDVWFVGYTPEWTAAVWEGFDKVDAKHYVTVGSGSTAALFKEIMSKSLEGRPVTNFVKPDNVPTPTETPSGITDLAAVYEIDKKSVKLSWTPLGDKTSYNVYRKGSKDADAKLLIQSPTPIVNDSSVFSGETYQYYVVPFNADTNVEGAKSNVASVEIPKDDTLPDGTKPSPAPGVSPTPSPGNGIEPTNPTQSPGTKPTPTPGNTVKPGVSPSSSPTPSPNANNVPSPTPTPPNKPGNGTPDKPKDGKPDAEQVIVPKTQ
ncbi:transglycosylase domain-containing protein [Paenibacillus aceris]|uniref:Penicillin-binding protein 2A n=1 Tax=Paenibacillus aceris TaxID=869555 RepID=A0ABS4HUY7_9BACL|nr:PBP1A family penicillin-binding protein [Paenibacillus aceris]MBP1961824.1 penicillin-binding protein 2A [Paenibacillus aceris]NHW34319.1 PBP1A family penicillin-binding protein [Paenibacillus aceris]